MPASSAIPTASLNSAKLLSTSMLCTYTGTTHMHTHTSYIRFQKIMGFPMSVVVLSVEIPSVTQADSCLSLTHALSKRPPCLPFTICEEKACRRDMHGHKSVSDVTSVKRTMGIERKSQSPPTDSYVAEPSTLGGNASKHKALQHEKLHLPQILVQNECINA